MAAAPTVLPTIEEVFPLFSSLFSRSLLKAWLTSANLTKPLKWRLFTPLIVLWCLVFQRLNADHTTDAVVSHLHTGAADRLDAEDRNRSPLSARLKSESTSAYCQARNRVPLELIQQALRHTLIVVEEDIPQEERAWHGRSVRFLDGTTFSLLATEDLDEAYRRAHNQHGEAVWVTVRSVIACCLHTLMVTGYFEGAETMSEQAMVRAVMEQDPATHAVYLGDSNFGIYLVVQVAQFLGHDVVVRLTKARFESLKRAATRSRKVEDDGQVWETAWSYKSGRYDETIPKNAVNGCVIAVHLRKKGFRPLTLYLFTTLMDDQHYPVMDIVELYAERWQIEIDYNHIKTTLEMELFTCKTTQMFRKELAAGLLTYNLICGVMTKAAQHKGVPTNRLSFSRCWRRIRDVLQSGVPRWVVEQGEVFAHMLHRLAQCVLPQQPNKVQHEPRKTHHRRSQYPSLTKGREQERQEVLRKLGAIEPGEEQGFPDDRDVAVSLQPKKQQKSQMREAA